MGSDSVMRTIVQSLDCDVKDLIPTIEIYLTPVINPALWLHDLKYGALNL
jgi:hypothetical protein